jgi:hypothetical protein
MQQQAPPMYRSDSDRLQNRAVTVNVSGGDNNLVKLTLI